ncbi:PTS glucose/sucrose transporter subunit IIB [Cellulomonas soli]|uniref:PTS glucose/sucrose transporter subunit IIB n=1 Tax=Cellulomonas soli TaxID=931535 RepID=UPI003F865575
MAEVPAVDVLAAQVLRLVGGPANVERLTHCWARLRFVLRDDTVADDAALGALPGVVMVVRQSGQLQVALQGGPLAVHAALAAQLGDTGRGSPA